MKITVLTLIVVGLLAPFLILGMSSFAHEWRWPQLLPASFSLRAWTVVFQDSQLWEALFVTAVIGMLVIVLNFLLGLPAGRALAYEEFKGKSLIETLLLLPILVPSLAIGMGLLFTAIRLGMADHWIGVVLIHLVPTLPYTIRILRAGYENIGWKYEEAARNLGASPFTVFKTVTFPLLFPSIRAVAALSFVISISQYVLTALIGGGQVITLAMIYYPYVSGADRPVTAAFSLLFIVLTIALLLMFESLFLRSRKKV